MNKNKKDQKRLQLMKEMYFIFLSAAYTTLAIKTCINLTKNELNKNDDTKEEKVVYVEELSSSDLENLILNSSKLSIYEKEALCNDDYITDVLDIINEDEERRSELYQLYTNLDIEYEEIEEEGVQGYVYLNESNIHLKKEYENNPDNLINVLAHEFIHVNQNSCKNLLTEASAEILASEYYNCEEDTYKYEIKLTKMLMEIIGPEPIIHYIYFNDKSLIQNNVKPYLSASEYDLFEKYYFDTYSVFDIPLNRQNYFTILDLVSKLHNNMYGKNMNDNPILNAQLNESKYERYYFNERYMDEEHSYYCDIEEFDMPFEDAISQGYFYPKNMKIAKAGEIIDENTPEVTFYIPTNPRSYHYGESAHVVDYVPQPVEPINKVFKKQIKKSN